MFISEIVLKELKNIIETSQIMEYAVTYIAKMTRTGLHPTESENRTWM